MTTRPRGWPLASLVSTALLAAVLLSSCSSSSTDAGVASLADATPAAGSSSATSSPAPDAEAQILSYVECLRGEGLDIGDPTVDDDGNMSLRGSGLGPGGGTGADAQDPIDRTKLLAAQEVCGEVPVGAFGFDPEDLTEMQDAALAYATCMREEGIPMADPDFSGVTASSPGAGRALLGDLDLTDPAVAAAMKTCQTVFTDAGLNAPGSGGGSR